MRDLLPSRLCLGAALAVLLSAAPALARWRAQPFAPPTAKAAPRPPSRPMNTRPPVRPSVREERQEHIQNWMEQHKNLSVPDQLKALDNEPGFHNLDPQLQQRMRNQLIRLNSMPEQRRDRRLEQNEILERMTVPQRQQYRSAVAGVLLLPPDRQRLMTSAIRNLRLMPPEQRDQVIESDRFKGQFSEGERSTLRTLLTVEPYPPVESAPQSP